jgi:hypothetical protein
MREWTGFIWPRIGTSGSRKRFNNPLGSLIVEEFHNEDGLCPIESVILFAFPCRHIIAFTVFVVPCLDLYSAY